MAPHTYLPRKKRHLAPSDVGRDFDVRIFGLRSKRANCLRGRRGLQRGRIHTHPLALQQTAIHQLCSP